MDLGVLLVGWNRPEPAMNSVAFARVRGKDLADLDLKRWTVVILGDESLTRDDPARITAGIRSRSRVLLAPKTCSSRQLSRWLSNGFSEFVLEGELGPRLADFRAASLRPRLDLCDWLFPPPAAESRSAEAARIVQTLNRPFDGEEWATSLGWSRQMLWRTCQAAWGVSPRTVSWWYVRAVVAHARARGAKLSELAQDLGFFDTAALSHTFRRHGTSVPPRRRPAIQSTAGTRDDSACNGGPANGVRIGARPLREPSVRSRFRTGPTRRTRTRRTDDIRCAAPPRVIVVGGSGAPPCVKGTEWLCIRPGHLASASLRQGEVLVLGDRALRALDPVITGKQARDQGIHVVLSPDDIEGHHLARWVRQGFLDLAFPEDLADHLFELRLLWQRPRLDEADWLHRSPPPGSPAAAAVAAVPGLVRAFSVAEWAGALGWRRQRLWRICRSTFAAQPSTVLSWYVAALVSKGRAAGMSRSTLAYLLGYSSSVALIHSLRHRPLKVPRRGTQPSG